MKKKLFIGGSTGSLGKQILKVIAKNPDKFEVIGLACQENTSLLKTQIKKFFPLFFFVANPEKRGEIPGSILTEKEFQQKIEKLPKDTLIINCISGSQGLGLTLQSLESGKDLILGNKESLVLAGEKILNLAEKKGINLMPLDSEHTAIYQILQETGNSISDIEKIILPCSGGPFFKKSQKDMVGVTIKEALSHPIWSKMGPKVTIDSATMINKALEMIEAHYLYRLSGKQIEVIIHPEAYLHAIVCLKKGGAIGLVSKNTMESAVLFSLGLKNKVRLIRGKTPKEIYSKLPKYHFILPDFQKFPIFSLVYRLMAQGNKDLARFGLISEQAVNQFLAGEITFLEIYKKIENDFSAS